MKNAIIGAMCLIFLLSANLFAYEYFSDFPNNTSKDLPEFCDQAIQVSTFNLLDNTINKNLYWKGYWQGQKDAYIMVKERL